MFCKTVSSEKNLDKKKLFSTQDIQFQYINTMRLPYMNDITMDIYNIIDLILNTDESKHCLDTYI